MFEALKIRVNQALEGENSLHPELKIDSLGVINDPEATRYTLQAILNLSNLHKLNPRQQRELTKALIQEIKHKPLTPSQQVILALYRREPGF